MSFTPVVSIWILSVLVFGFNLLPIPAAAQQWKFDRSVDFQSINGYPLAEAEYQTAPTETVIFNLPIIEQAAPTETPLPEAIYPAPVTEVDVTTATPTPTPIPVQTGSFNLPIVIGAVGIILVIILAWFFIGYLPRRNKEAPPENRT